MAGGPRHEQEKQGKQERPGNRAAVLHAAGDVRLENRPVPRPGPRELLVEMRSVGVCGSDVHYYEDGRLGDFVVEEPLVLGHEVSGVVAELGPDAPGPAPGTRVALEPGVPCRTCELCKQGRYNLCPDVRFFATPPVDGAFQRFVTHPVDLVYPVPDEISDDAAALLEPLSVAVWACWKAGVTAGTRVLVTGAGPIGLLVSQAARALGAADIAVSDVLPQRLELARSLGADTAIDASSGGLPQAGVKPDALLECSGSSAAWDEAIRLVRPAGRVVLVGMGVDEARLPVPVVQRQELWVTGTFRYTGTWPAARALAASGAVNLDRLATGHFRLADTDQALRATRDDPASVKPIVRPVS